MVIGAGADLSWANSSGNNTCFGIAGGKFFASNCRVHPDLFSTITGRLGYVNPLPQQPIGPAAGLSNNVRLKLGLNYRFGAHPAVWSPIPGWSPPCR